MYKNKLIKNRTDPTVAGVKASSGSLATSQAAGSTAGAPPSPSHDIHCRHRQQHRSDGHGLSSEILQQYPSAANQLQSTPSVLPCWPAVTML